MALAFGSLGFFYGQYLDPFIVAVIPCCTAAQMARPERRRSLVEADRLVSPVGVRW